jgi:hypothetical protein
MERVEDRVDQMLFRAESKTIKAFGHVPEDDGQGSMSAQVRSPAGPHTPPSPDVAAFRQQGGT